MVLYLGTRAPESFSFYLRQLKDATTLERVLCPRECPCSNFVERSPGFSLTRGLILQAKVRGPFLQLPCSWKETRGATACVHTWEQGCLQTDRGLPGGPQSPAMPQPASNKAFLFERLSSVKLNKNLLLKRQAYGSYCKVSGPGRMREDDQQSPAFKLTGL